MKLQNQFLAKASFALLLYGLLAGPLWGQTQKVAKEPGSVVNEIAAEAESVLPTIETEWVKSWLQTAKKLPQIIPFEVSLKEKTIQVDEDLFYVGRYGSPVAYARALDLIAKAGCSGIEKKRILDFGYGSIGQLRMLALSGAEVVGVDVAPLLPIMYANQEGSLGNGSVKLVSGSFPSEPKTVESVGASFDLVISKNTLKRGYIHPTREARPETLIQLGVDDATFLRSVHRCLNAKGFFAIYNICPAKAKPDQAYIPWAEGESPFSREQFEAAGFEVLSLDVVDDEAVRKLATKLGWDKSMQLESDLFAWYTIVRKR